MGADKNSIREFGLWTRFQLCTSASFSCQVHSATEVLLNLGARPNQQPQQTRSGNTRHGCWQPKPVRPVSETGQTASVGLSLTQSGETGQTGLANRSDRLCPKTPQKPKISQKPFHIWTKEVIAQQRLPCSKTLLDNPQGETGQTGLGNRFDQFLPRLSGRTHPVGKTQPFHQSISRFVPRMKVRLWG
jgi:hypothetical protein